MPSKKNFRTELNPALQFISTAPTPPPSPQEASPAVDAGTVSDAVARPAAPAHEAKHKPNPLYMETKSKRLQLLVQPSVYEKIRENADAAKMSVNHYIHMLLEKDTEI